MEYGWKCFLEQRFMTKSRTCRITIIITYIILFTILTLSVAVYSYAKENFFRSWSSASQMDAARPEFEQG